MVLALLEQMQSLSFKKPLVAFMMLDMLNNGQFARVDPRLSYSFIKIKM